MRPTQASAPDGGRCRRAVRRRIRSAIAFSYSTGYAALPHAFFRPRRSFMSSSSARIYCSPRTEGARMRLRFLPAAAFLIVSIVGGTLVARSKRPITETDLFQFTWIGDPQVSPDGSRVVFVRVNVNARKDGYDSALFVAATTGDEQPRRLTTGPRDSSPRWSPDGNSLAFVRGFEQDGKRPPPQLFLLSMQGGEPLQLTDMPKGAAS